MKSIQMIEKNITELLQISAKVLKVSKRALAQI